MNLDNLPIPPLPASPVPILRPGWQWLDAHWAAYWMMKYQGIDNREKSLEIPCPMIEKEMEILRWWQHDEAAALVFAEAIKCERGEIGAKLYEWCANIGLCTEKNYINKTGAHREIPELENTSLYQVLEKYFLHEPVRFSSDTKFLGDGRHRVYRAWQCHLPTIFAWVT